MHLFVSITPPLIFHCQINLRVMRLALYISYLLLSFLVFVRAYDIQAIVQALSADFALEEGTFNLFNISECKDTPACTVNNPESPYIWYNFSSWGGNFGHLREDEAIVAIQAAPPPCVYFGYTPYIITRNTNEVSKVLFASLSDTLNMNTVSKGSDGTIALILEKFLLPNSTNNLPLPGTELNLGLESEADTFGILSRFALFQNSGQGQNYLRNIPGYVFKLTPKIPDQTTFFSYPTFRPYGPTSNNENHLQTTLYALINAIRASESSVGLVQPSVDVEHLTDYQNGFSCINKSINCLGDNRDVRYLRAGNIYIQNNTDSHTWVAGVQHQLTGKATYIAVSVYDEERQLGVLSVPQTKMTGSAQKFLPSNPDALLLYALKFARSCAPMETYCFVVPSGFPGVPLDSTISFVERVYVEPIYNVGPAYGSIINPQLIRYKSTPASTMVKIV